MKIRKGIILLITLLLIAAGCAYGVDRIANEHFNSFDAEVDTASVYQDDADIIWIYSCEINDGAVNVTGPDPQFAVSANDQEISRIHIKFVEPVSSDTFLQIFFAPVGSTFDEQNSTSRTIEAGSQDAFFQIPKTAYNALRFDFEQNVKLDKIYVGKEEHIVLIDQPNYLRLITVFCIVFVPLCVLVLVRRKPGGLYGEGIGELKTKNKAGNNTRQFFYRRRKAVLIAVLLIAAILGSWYVGRKLHPEGLLGRYAVQERGTAEAAGVSAEIEGKDVRKGSTEKQEKSFFSFENSAPTGDNPWGFTAGVIEMENEGDCLFLTPGTGVKVDLEEVEYTFDCSLHPAVAEGSDGVSVKAELLDIDGNSLFVQEEMIHGADIVPIKVDREKWPDARTIHMICGNGENGNSDADWLVIKRR